LQDSLKHLLEMLRNM